MYQLHPATGICISLGILALTFLINCFVCTKNVLDITIMKAPGYRQPIVPGKYQVFSDIRNIESQRNFTLVNIILLTAAAFPMLLVLLTSSN